MPELRTRVVLERREGESLEPMYYTWVGLTGKMYRLTFDELMRFISVRCGREQARLEFKR